MEWIAVMITIIGADGTSSLPIVDTKTTDFALETKEDCEASLVFYVATMEGQLRLRENLKGNLVATSNLEEPKATGLHLACVPVPTH